MSHLPEDVLDRARELVALYPKPRSALIPLCHLAQEQDGWLRPEAMAEIAELVGVTPAEVRGTASFYDMLHTEPVGRHVIAICTNVACLLGGALELLEHAEECLGIGAGGTTADGAFTLEEAECLADCDYPPCVQVNHRFVRTQTADAFDRLLDDLSAGRLAEDVPPHGTLVRVRRRHTLEADPGRVVSERAAEAEAKRGREALARAKGAQGGNSG